MVSKVPVNSEASKKEPDKIRDLKYSMKRDLKKLKKKFVTFQCEVRESLGTKEVHKKIIAHVLADYANVFKSANMEAVSLFTDSDVKMLNSAISVDDVFRVLQNYWSFLECDMLFSIVKHYGDDGDRTKVKEYQQDLKNFFENRKLSEIPQQLLDMSTCEDRINDKILIKFDIEDPPWTEIKDLESKICDILDVKPSVLLIVGFTQGCLEVTFNIPKHVGKLIFNKPPSREQCDKFKAASVLKLTCGKFHTSFVVSLILLVAMPRNICAEFMSGSYSAVSFDNHSH